MTMSVDSLKVIAMSPIKCEVVVYKNMVAAQLCGLSFGPNQIRNHHIMCSVELICSRRSLYKMYK